MGFDGGEVTSDSGLLVLRQVEQRLGLLKAAARVLPDPRNPFLVVHTTEQLPRQRVFGLCQGYEDLNDHDRLRCDPALQTALDKRGTKPELQLGNCFPAGLVTCRSLIYGTASSAVASPSVYRPVATVGNSQPWRPFIPDPYRARGYLALNARCALDSGRTGERGGRRHPARSGICARRAEPTLAAVSGSRGADPVVAGEGCVPNP